MRLFPAVCVLCVLPVLAACSGPGASARDAELEELRARVERMEREAAGERARLEGELEALRRTVDEAGRRAAVLDQPGEGPAPQGGERAGRSPRAALKQSFNEALEASRQAIARLNRSLEESLWRGGARPEAAPSGPSGPSGPAAPGAPQPPKPE